MDIKKKTIDFVKNKYNIIFLVVLIISLIIRWKYLFVETVWVDETVYMWQGYRLLHNPFLIFSQNYYGNVPIPLAISSFFNIFFNRFIAARLMGMCFGISGIIIIYLIGKEVKNKFLGLLAAIILSFHHLHWFFSTRALVDVPLATMYSLAFYALLLYNRKKTKFTLLFLIISIILVPLTKMPGLIVVPAIILFYLLYSVFDLKNNVNKFKNLIKTRRKISLIIFLIFIILIWRNWDAITGQLQRISYYNNLVQHWPFVFSNELIAFIFIGLIISLIYHTKVYLVIFSGFITFIAAFTFLDAGPYPRYLLPAVPLGIILALIALFEIINYIKIFLGKNISNIAKIGLIIFILIISFNFYNNGSDLCERTKYSYIGYQEVGKWMKDNFKTQGLIKTDSQVPLGIMGNSDVYNEVIHFDKSIEKDKRHSFYVGSQGPCRLFSGFNYNSDQDEPNLEGPINQIQKLNLSNLNTYPKPIYIHIDMFEPGQPGWAYPITQEKINNLINLGFVPELIVKKPMPVKTPQGETIIADMEVQFILVKYE